MALATIYDLDLGIDVEIVCRWCGRHQGECDDNPPCCPDCTHTDDTGKAA